MYDQLGLRIVNETCRSFIRIGLPRSQALRIKADRAGGWHHRSSPLFLVLVAACLYIIVTQRGSLTQAETLLPAALSTVLLVSRVSGLPTCSSAAAPVEAAS